MVTNCTCIYCKILSNLLFNQAVLFITLHSKHGLFSSRSQFYSHQNIWWAYNSTIFSKSWKSSFKTDNHNRVEYTKFRRVSGGTHSCSASWFSDNVVNFCTHFDYYTLICKKLASWQFHLARHRELQKWVPPMVLLIAGFEALLVEHEWICNVFVTVFPINTKF